MSTNYNTCFIDSNGKDVSEEFVEKTYLLDVYPNLVDPLKMPLLWMWGNLGSAYATPNCRSSPVQIISNGTNWKQIEFSDDTGVAVKTDGTLWVWGSGGSGERGNNTAASDSSPVQTISAGNNWRQVSIYKDHVGAVKTDGTLWMWGQNSNGQLGRNNVISASSPVQTVSGGTNWKQVSVADIHTAAIKTDGSLWLWGNGGNGRLGNNASVSQSSPVQTVSATTNWRQVSAGHAASAATKTDGTLWVWGDGAGGSLGDNTTAAKSSPIQTIAGGSNWKSVVSKCRNVAGIKTDGTLWVWGCNQFGQLGTGNYQLRSSPVQTISGGTSWKQAFLGFCHSGGIKTDGTLWVWGGNSVGQLGKGDTLESLVPTQTIMNGNYWKAAAGGQFATIAINEGEDW